jgi:hypothetical protein
MIAPRSLLWSSGNTKMSVDRRCFGKRYDCRSYLV